MEWTTRQEELLRERGYLGARAVRDAIERECGVSHSVRAVEMHASRIHVSLARRTVCPACRAVGVHLNRQSGMCARCTELMHVEEERAFNELLEAEARERDGGPEVERLRRAYDKLRQRNSRLRRAFGLKGKRGR